MINYEPKHAKNCIIVHLKQIIVCMYVTWGGWLKTGK